MYEVESGGLNCFAMPRPYRFRYMATQISEPVGSFLTSMRV